MFSDYADLSPVRKSATPVAHCSAAGRTGNLVFVGVNGAIITSGSLLHSGEFGPDVTIESRQLASQLSEEVV